MQENVRGCLWCCHYCGLEHLELWPVCLLKMCFETSNLFVRANQVIWVYAEGNFLTTDELPGTVFPQEDIITALQLLLLVPLQQLADELLGQLAGVAEELLIELITYGGDVPQGVLLGLSQERRSTTQPGTRNTEGWETDGAAVCCLVKPGFHYWTRLRSFHCLCTSLSSRVGDFVHVIWITFWCQTPHNGSRLMFNRLCEVFKVITKLHFKQEKYPDHLATTGGRNPE